MGILAGPTVYGAVRGFQDAGREIREEEAHEGDQAIRAERLKSEQDLRPLRRRGLELGLEEQERQLARRPAIEQQEDELRQLNIDISKLNKREKSETYDRLVKARGREDRLNEGLRKFYQSSDPQHVVDAFEESAEGEGKHKGATATRDQTTGEITLSIPGIGEQKFKAGKDKAGNMRSADDYFGMFAMKMLSPIERLKTELTEEYGLAKEAERTTRAFGVADRRGAAQVEAAQERGAISGSRLSEAWYNRQHGQIKPVLDSLLKPEASPSGFAAAYAFDADKALRGVMEQKVEEEIEQGVPVRRAANNVVNDVRAAYDELDKAARAAAKKLSDKKIKANDRKAVEAAAAKGDPDARALLKVYEVAGKNMGLGVAKYLEQQMTGK